MYVYIYSYNVNSWKEYSRLFYAYFMGLFRLAMVKYSWINFQTVAIHGPDESRRST